MRYPKKMKETGSMSMRSAAKPVFGAIWVVVCATIVSSAVANGPPSSAPIRVRKLIEKMDADRDSRISRTEWRMQGMPVSNFRKLDRNGDGFVSRRELLARPPRALDATRDGVLSPREMTFGKAAGRVAPKSR
ncbi:hypothetical protein [Sphingomonas sp. Ant20]|uniref:hypothetical protein n=1 Tax=Sphingomonas sp. Ant20 TaxID=104605 RepID=UPI000A05A9CE|nr:hypothetical protein [Sphingomonas sp. Ant20]